MKAPQDTSKSDIELAVDEGERRYVERVMNAYSEIGSITRTAQLMRLSAEDVKAVVEAHS
jgi:hypothetical protein